MRIGINALCITLGKWGGNETYLFNLIQALACVDKINEYVIFTTRENARYFCPDQSNFHYVGKYIPRNTISRISFENIVLPRLINKIKIDIYHSPVTLLPFFPLKCKTIVNIHDLRFVHLPIGYSKMKIFYKNLSYRNSTKRADAIICISHYTKKDLLEFAPINSEKIEVTYGGVNRTFSPINKKKSDEIRNKYGISNKYILSISNYRHKNVESLINTFKILKKREKIPHQLVIIGKAVSQLNTDIILLENVPNEDMPLLYSSAEIFVFLSLFEGFGLPPLEAMASGCPVVSSNRTSLPEVIGDTGILIDPEDTKEIIVAIMKVISNNNLRENLIQKGLERAKQFSWENTAKKTLEIYNKICNK